MAQGGLQQTVGSEVLSTTEYVPEVTDKRRNTAVYFARDLMNTNWISYHFRSGDTFVSFLMQAITA
jgi:hypothetical protein